MKPKDTAIVLGVVFIILITAARYYFSHPTFILSACIEYVKTSGIIFAIIWVVIISILYDKVLPRSDNL